MSSVDQPLHYHFNPLICEVLYYSVDHVLVCQDIVASEQCNIAPDSQPGCYYDSSGPCISPATLSAMVSIHSLGSTNYVHQNVAVCVP